MNANQKYNEAYQNYHDLLKLSQESPADVALQVSLAVAKRKLDWEIELMQQREDESIAQVEADLQS